MVDTCPKRSAANILTNCVVYVDRHGNDAQKDAMAAIRQDIGDALGVEPGLFRLKSTESNPIVNGDAIARLRAIGMRAIDDGRASDAGDSPNFQKFNGAMADLTALIEAIAPPEKLVKRGDSQNGAGRRDFIRGALWGGATVTGLASGGIILPKVIDATFRPNRQAEVVTSEKRKRQEHAMAVTTMADYFNKQMDDRKTYLNQSTPKGATPSNIYAYDVKNNKFNDIDPFSSTSALLDLPKNVRYFDVGMHVVAEMRGLDPVLKRAVDEGAGTLVLRIVAAYPQFLNPAYYSKNQSGSPRTWRDYVEAAYKQKPGVTLDVPPTIMRAKLAEIARSQGASQGR